MNNHITVTLANANKIRIPLAAILHYDHAPIMSGFQITRTWIMTDAITLAVIETPDEVRALIDALKMIPGDPTADPDTRIV